MLAPSTTGSALGTTAGSGVSTWATSHAEATASSATPDPNSLTALGTSRMLAPVRRGRLVGALQEHVGTRRQARAGVEDGGQRLDAVDQPRPGPREINGDDAPAEELARHQAIGLGQRLRPTACRRAPGPRPPDRCGAPRPRPPARERPPGSPSTGSPPAAATTSGTQWPAVNGGSSHSRTRVGTGARPPTASRTASSRAWSAATSSRPRSGSPAASATSATDAITWSRRCGSSVTTAAAQPMRASAASTSPVGTAHTRHRSWVRRSSGAISRDRGVVEAVQPAVRRLGTHPLVDLCPASARPAGASGRRRACCARRGASRTRRSRPAAGRRGRARYTISVADGRSETIRTARCYLTPDATIGAAHSDGERDVPSICHVPGARCAPPSLPRARPESLRKRLQRPMSRSRRQRPMSRSRRRPRPRRRRARRRPERPRSRNAPTSPLDIEGEPDWPLEGFGSAVGPGSGPGTAGDPPDRPRDERDHRHVPLPRPGLPGLRRDRRRRSGPASRMASCASIRSRTR